MAIIHTTNGPADRHNRHTIIDYFYRMGKDGFKFFLEENKRGNPALTLPDSPARWVSSEAYFVFLDTGMDFADERFSAC